MTSVSERFWVRVIGGDVDTCWEWTGRTNDRGYGRLIVSGRETKAHRYAYEELVGPIPHGLVIDHLCRTRNCVNPWHMEPVPSRVNTLRGTGPTALNRAKTHCPAGHSYAEHGYQGRDGRHCRPCRQTGGVAA